MDDEDDADGENRSDNAMNSHAEIVNLLCASSNDRLDSSAEQSSKSALSKTPAKMSKDALDVEDDLSEWGVPRKKRFMSLD